MDLFPKPVEKGYTVYSKSNCNDCVFIKDCLKDFNIPFVEINCDAFDRTHFLFFLSSQYNCHPTSYPIVFLDGLYLGKPADVLQFIEFSQDCCTKQVDF